jgi:hypothetical protein
MIYAASINVDCRRAHARNARSRPSDTPELPNRLFLQQANTVMASRKRQAWHPQPCFTSAKPLSNRFAPIEIP